MAGSDAVGYFILINHQLILKDEENNIFISTDVTQ